MTLKPTKRGGRIKVMGMEFQAICETCRLRFAPKTHSKISEILLNENIAADCGRFTMLHLSLGHQVCVVEDDDYQGIESISETMGLRTLTSEEVKLGYDHLPF